MQIETGNALRHRLFSRLLQSRWNELERFHTGDVVNRVEQDTAAIVTLLTLLSRHSSSRVYNCWQPFYSSTF